MLLLAARADIAHRDVKCNNVLLRNCPAAISKDMDILDIADPEEQRVFATAWDVCLTDFGLSAENKRAPAMTAVCGTVVTMAPGLPLIQRGKGAGAGAETHRHTDSERGRGRGQGAGRHRDTTHKHKGKRGDREAHEPPIHKHTHAVERGFCGVCKLVPAASHAHRCYCAALVVQPEVLADVGLYSPLCDVWSLGVVIFRL